MMIQQALADLKEVLENIEKRGINLELRKEKSMDFKITQSAYYAREIENKIDKIKAVLTSISLKDYSREVQSSISLIPTLEQRIREKKFAEALNIIGQIREKTRNIKMTETKTRQQDIFAFNVKLPQEIDSEVRNDIAEMKASFENRSYRGALMLAGRILEIALHRKYFELTDIDLLEKNPEIGLGKLAQRLHEKGFFIEPGLSQQIHLINQLRIHSVHKKASSFRPTKEQTLAIMLYTIDTLKKLFP